MDSRTIQGHMVTQQKRHFFSFPGTFKPFEQHRSHFKSANTIMFTICTFTLHLSSMSLRKLPLQVVSTSHSWPTFLCNDLFSPHENDLYYIPSSTVALIHAETLF